jgi:succinate dehydrogenase/fumarate reductase cytochrome b subunit
MKAARVQAASGAAFALFLSLHLATTSSATLGISTYDRVLAALRAIYRPSLSVEIVLIAAPALVHVVCAARALWRRRNRPPARPPWSLRVHRWAGWTLAAVIVGHVFATRVMPALAIGPAATGRAEFSYLAYSVLNWPIFIIPYYLIFGLAGAAHLALGLAYAVRVLAPSQTRTAPTVRLGVVAACLVAALVTAGVTSVIAHAREASPIRFPEYHAIYERCMPFMPSDPRVSPTDHSGN